MVEAICDNTVMLYNRITLLTDNGDSEVSNPFMVTEVYVKEYGNWYLANLFFSKLLERD